MKRGHHWKWEEVGKGRKELNEITPKKFSRKNHFRRRKQDEAIKDVGKIDTSISVGHHQSASYTVRSFRWAFHN